MSITYKFEFGNSEIKNFSDFVEKTFKTVLECGKIIVKEQLENLDEKVILLISLPNILLLYPKLKVLHSFVNEDISLKMR